MENDRDRIGLRTQRPRLEPEEMVSDECIDETPLRVHDQELCKAVPAATGQHQHSISWCLYQICQEMISFVVLDLQ